MSITFGCDPARMDELIKSAFRVIGSSVKPAVDGRVADARLAVRQDLENDLQQNRYLLNEITDQCSNGEDVSGVFVVPSGLDELTPEMIQDAARLYLNKSRYVEVTLSPEGSSATRTALVLAGTDPIRPAAGRIQRRDLAFAP